MKTSGLSACLILWMASLAVGEIPQQVTPQAPTGGEPLIAIESVAPDKLGSHVAAGLRKKMRIVALDAVDAAPTSVKQSAELSLFDQPKNTWDASLSVATDTALSKGDRVLVGCWVRGTSLDEKGQPVASDGGVMELVFERRSPPHTKSVQYLVETEPGNQWKHIWVRCECKEDYAAGECGIGFQIGYQPQRIEVAGIEAWRYPADRSIESLPMTSRSYVGREPDSPWRTEADERIDQHRKCNLTIKVVDQNGQPVSGDQVSIQQTRHAFRFGTAVSVGMIGRQDSDGEKYRSELQRLFNVGTIENGLKWKMWDKTSAQQHQQVLSAVDWLGEHGLDVRGHVLVWPAQKNSPPWISSLYDSPEALDSVVRTHIREMGYATQGRVTDWDVLNEAFDNDEFEQHLGPDCFTKFFQEADSVLPDTDLYYNDYAGLVRAGVNTYHKDHFEMIIQRLVDQGAPIDGIGIQGHFGEILTPPHRIVRELDRWGKFGLKILITEFDVGIPDQTLMADFTGDFLTACFSHPDVDGIMTWGFWAGSHWRPDSALFDRQWNPTPLGKRWTELTHGKWWTNETANLNASGATSIRVFKGDHQVTLGDQTWNVTANGDQEVTLVRGEVK